METLILFNDNCEEHLQQFDGKAHITKFDVSGRPKILNNFSILEIYEDEIEEDEEEIDEYNQDEYEKERTYKDWVERTTNDMD